MVILTLSKNNPIESAREARFKEDIRTFQDELAMYISKEYTNKGGARDEKITATNYNPAGDPASVYTYIPSFSKKYEGKFVIKNDELMYKEDMIQQEKDWCQSINVKENAKTGAEKAKEDPQTYYGAKVDYKTGNENIDNDIKEWKIFYSDGSNVYIISSGYISPSNFPEKNGVKPDQVNSTNCPRAARFNNILSKYSTGSVGITDEKMKAFNSDYYEKGYTSGNFNNFKAVAYMLDKDIWKNFANSSVAEFAVGSPSIEMFLRSYSEKNNVDFRANVSNTSGYYMSQDGGINWEQYYLKMLNTTETLYVLPQSSEANALWLASPSARNPDALIVVYYDGSVSCAGYDLSYYGFRPLVCLNSNISLKWNDTTQKYDIE